MVSDLNIGKDPLESVTPEKPKKLPRVFHDLKTIKNWINFSGYCFVIFLKKHNGCSLFNFNIV